MPEPVRFPAQLPYVDSEPCLEVFAAIVAGDWALAQQRYDANPAATSNTMGAVRYWRDQYNPTPPDVVVVDMQPFGGANYRHHIENFGPQTYAFRFVVPDGPPLQVYGSSTVVEYHGEPALRMACISLLAGDFAHPIGYVSEGVQASAIWTRGDGSDYQKLVPGTYFFNVRNKDYGTGNFPALVETMWPK